MHYGLWNLGKRKRTVNYNLCSTINYNYAHIIKYVNYDYVHYVSGCIVVVSYSLMGRRLCSVMPPFDQTEGSANSQQVRANSIIIWAGRRRLLDLDLPQGSAYRQPYLFLFLFIYLNS